MKFEVNMCKCPPGKIKKYGSFYFHFYNLTGHGLEGCTSIILFVYAVLFSIFLSSLFLSVLNIMFVFSCFVLVLSSFVVYCFLSCLLSILYCWTIIERDAISKFYSQQIIVMSLSCICKWFYVFFLSFYVLFFSLFNSEEDEKMRKMLPKTLRQSVVPLQILSLESCGQLKISTTFCSTWNYVKYS